MQPEGRVLLGRGERSGLLRMIGESGWMWSRRKRERSDFALVLESNAARSIMSCCSSLTKYDSIEHTVAPPKLALTPLLASLRSSQTLSSNQPQHPHPPLGELYSEMLSPTSITCEGPMDVPSPTHDSSHPR